MIQWLQTVAVAVIGLVALGYLTRLALQRIKPRDALASSGCAGCRGCGGASGCASRLDRLEVSTVTFTPVHRVIDRRLGQPGA